MSAGRLREAVAFDEDTGSIGSLGGRETAWTERHACRGQWIYQRGDEAVQAARLAGRSVHKIKIRSCDASRAITVGYRMRNTRRGLPDGVGTDTLPGSRWNVREVDAITDPMWVYIVVEGEVVS
ncbi:phage head completion protein [Salipiger thiooxidans]|uniref:phage head completion protein n=1 Tax=Salipiger thiooxidans TaxID=282683 RepID=UPI001CD396EB|nr:head-tail adaptor protein [Salipiger thiooxidans]MCA0848333.1 head-tail adaptor protein [Salipiger thiooxidans]